MHHLGAARYGQVMRQAVTAADCTLVCEWQGFRALPERQTKKISILGIYKLHSATVYTVDAVEILTPYPPLGSGVWKYACGMRHSHAPERQVWNGLALVPRWPGRAARAPQRGNLSFH